MIINKLNYFPVLILLTILRGSDLQSPSQFLGYDLGDKFTFHHDAVDYFEHVSNGTNHVELINYGETYEGRPLIVSVITHPNNKQLVKTIRKNHLITSGLIDGAKRENPLSIVWLSYSVHGNESSSMEAALKTLYTFADTTNDEQMKWLEKVVLIIDPCINPDGRDRYANFYRMTGNLIPDIDPKTREHREPWPGGRTNHYYHDLNRDWSWQTQKETQYRLKLYKEWMPHVHVDYHEQSYNEPYYFAPAVEPYHELITPWQREFQNIIGNNNADYFDKRQLLYFRNEDFDLLYPAYGDTYPIYNGAIGMTYEKAGGGSGGIAVKTSATDTLTLKERLEHHYLTALATVEATYNNSERVIQEFQTYFKNANAGPFKKFKTYIISKDNNDNKIKDFLTLLDLNGIKYGRPVKPTQMMNKVFDYQSGKRKNIKVFDGDILISTQQDMSVLTQVLFDPQTIISDTLTYDITAWSLPYVYGLKAFATEKELAIQEYISPIVRSPLGLLNSSYYGALVHWGSVNALKFLAGLLKNKVVVRVAEKSFTHNGINYEPGALFISPKGNEHLGKKLPKIVYNAANKYNPPIVTISTGKSSKGIDLGSSNFRVIKAPRIAVIGGDGVSSRNFGEIWHYFEQEVEYPVSVFNSSNFKSIPFKNIDVLILPDGNYGFLKTETLPSAQIKKETSASLLIKKSPPPELLKWVKEGGRLIVIGSAMEKFVDQKGYGLVKYESEAAKKEAKKNDEKQKLADRDKKYRERKRSKLIDNTYGSIVKIELDNTHPLAFGYDVHYFALKLEKNLYPLLPKGWNVGILKNSDSHIAGFMGHRIKKKINNNLIFGVHEAKKGRIIYMADDPLFRSFWYNSKVLFGNAVFFVGG
jgi:hypothetical protein